ncbi:MAG TPA: hypothetical protein VF679_05250, partial [Pedobacter sp.]
MYTITDRLANLKEAISSRQKLLGFVQRCKEDRVFFCNNCLDTYNPQLKLNKDIPFFLCLRQEEYVEATWDAINAEEDLVKFKSRKVGGSWLEMGPIDLWGWLFVD